MAIATATIKAALVSALTTAFAADSAVQVVYGEPVNPPTTADVVAVMKARTDVDGDEEVATYDLVVSCYAGGGPESAATVAARAYTLLGTVRSTLVADPTLSSACRVAALLDDHEMAEAEAKAPGGMPVGRLATIEAGVRAWTGRGVLGSLASAHNVP